MICSADQFQQHNHTPGIPFWQVFIVSRPVQQHIRLHALSVAHCQDLLRFLAPYSLQHACQRARQELGRHGEV